jgi:hypothetical protein
LALIPCELGVQHGVVGLFDRGVRVVDRLVDRADVLVPGLLHAEPPVGDLSPAGFGVLA